MTVIKLRDLIYFKLTTYNKYFICIYKKSNRKKKSK